MSQKLDRLKDILGEVSDINHAIAVLSWDQQVNMPPGGNEARGRQLGTLGKLAQEKFIADEVGSLLEDLTWTSQNQKGTRLACIKHVKECMIKTENSSQCGFRSLRQHLSGISLFSRFDRLTLMRLRHILPFSPRRVV